MQFPFDSHKCALEFELSDHLIVDNSARDGNKTNSTDEEENENGEGCVSSSLGPIGRVLSDVELQLQQCTQLLSSEYESDEWHLSDLTIGTKDYEFTLSERRNSRRVLNIRVTSDLYEYSTYTVQ